MKKKHDPSHFIQPGPTILIAAFFVVGPSFATDFYGLGNEESLISDPMHYPNSDGDATAAAAAPSKWDDLFFSNLSVKGPADRILQTGTATKAYRSMTFRGNAEQSQINRLSDEKSPDRAIIYIGAGGITFEAGAGLVTFGDSGQMLAIGAKADFTSANHSSSDLILNREVRGYTNNTVHTITVAESGNTVFKEIWDNSHGREIAMTITTSGTGVVRFDGKNTRKGPTNVAAGKLLIDGNATSADGAVEVSPVAILGGAGSLGGNLAIADNGCLEFEFRTPAEEHDAMDLTDSRKPMFAGASVLTITSPGGASIGKYKLLTSPGETSGTALATPTCLRAERLRFPSMATL